MKRCPIELKNLSTQGGSEGGEDMEAGRRQEEQKKKQLKVVARNLKAQHRK